ncbi:hypothetical protein RMATCC62417_05486 [Rhizopus microsporus]|nr:hypothetical protein RMATCC62417_05486 [Rhizopus microsporus]
MYFDLPKRQDRIAPKVIKDKIIQMGITEERISEILNNIEDHWGSPPILTPDTLAYILSHQWENDKKVKCICFIKTGQECHVHINYGSQAEGKVIEDQESHSPRNVQLLIQEFCNTIQKLDKNKSFSVTNDIMNDNIIQPFIQQPNTTSEQQDKAVNRLVELLQHHNKTE